MIGHPEYYPRFGFQPAGLHGLELKQFEVPENVFMVCELKEGVLQRIKGELKYPETFFELLIILFCESCLAVNQST